MRRVLLFFVFLLLIQFHLKGQGEEIYPHSDISSLTNQNIITNLGFGFRAIRYAEQGLSKGPDVSANILIYDPAPMSWFADARGSYLRFYFPTDQNTYDFLHLEGGIGLTDGKSIFFGPYFGFITELTSKSQNSAFTGSFRVTVRFDLNERISVNLSGHVGTTFSQLQGTTDINSSMYAGGSINVGFKLFSNAGSE